MTPRTLLALVAGTLLLGSPAQAQFWGYQYSQPTPNYGFGSWFSPRGQYRINNYSNGYGSGSTTIYTPDGDSVRCYTVNNGYTANTFCN